VVGFPTTLRPRDTPLAADGALRAGPNQVYALDALTGEALWNYSRPAGIGLVGDASLGTNRGVAILRDKVFFVTDNAHLLGLDRASGKLLWETTMAADANQPYGGTVAPLIVNDTVVAGVAGADHGIRGFVAAYKPDTGALVWRHWTVPRSGEPGIETWQGKEPIAGGGSTWLTGSYDPSSDTLYWPTGNPWPDGDDRDRPGDNLYTNCVLALNGKTGELKWHYQFTPHDLKDRDATEPNVLVDRVYKGKPSKLLLHADRNGFFYVLDRTDGKVLLAKPFLRRVDWASSIAPDGRPVVTDPRGCPSDAANWSRSCSLRKPPRLLSGAGRTRRRQRLPRSNRSAFACREHRDRRSRGKCRSRGRRGPRRGAASPPRRPDCSFTVSRTALRSRRSTRRADIVAVSDQRAHEGLAYDLQRRRPACRGWGGLNILFWLVRNVRGRSCCGAIATPCSRERIRTASLATLPAARLTVDGPDHPASVNA
jgi:outer membrane protein assembly factor BamB